MVQPLASNTSRASRVMRPASAGPVSVDRALPAVESAHAFAGARRYALAHPGVRLLIGLSGRGDKDLPILDAWERR